MITLYGTGPIFGLPDASPFVTKTEVLLKMAGVPYRTAEGGFGKAPKGKIPYIDDGGTLLGDSTFIRWHLEEKYGADFDGGLSAVDKATAWAFEKLCEEHLYWPLVHSRWMIPANFDNGPRKFFDRVPAVGRPIVAAMVKRLVRKALAAQGTGRHSQAEIERLAIRDIDSIAAFLGDKPWLMGVTPCGADAAVFATVLGVMCPAFETPIRTAAERHPNLVAYRDRGMARWYPEMAKR